MSFELEMMGRGRNFTGDAAERGLIKTGAGKLLALEVQNVNGATRYLWLFDGLLAGTIALIAPIQIATGAGVRLTFPVPRSFATGLFFNASDTIPFNTSAGADLIVTAQFI
jgi:hypothetical protein